MRIAATAWTLLLLACGGAVTDPGLEGFDHDPRPITGTWTTTYRDGAAQEHVLDAELLATGGGILGRFDFFWAGRQWRVQFQDGTWDGIRVRFTTQETVDAGGARAVDWIATHFPASNGKPPRLLLTSDLFFVPIEYLRP